MMKKGSSIAVVTFSLLMALVLSIGAFAATVSPRTREEKKSKSQKVAEAPRAQKHISHLRRHRARTYRAHARRHRRYYERFYTSSFADDIAEGDVTAGEDPVVREAAVQALGNMNGTVVAIDPDSGRILAMVNQKLALSSGAQPCSTIKVAVALAALSENVITKDTEIPLGRTWKMDLTNALAHSNNAYFEAVGRKLGFEKVSYYAHQFGLGELAGWKIPNEHLGMFPDTELDQKLGGVGKMCSFGESISLTPLQLAGLIG